ncbi:PREDICTED: bolA-like protein 3 [Tinamus guttatus]|uniref:bolA-like protein 3 n=1 Tax=Tinamus guttatus TaxID=94827 RepID=UPI00052ECB1F|nr:PREDICTED: bolA-like protein 3 [Tinamus guttatus]
MPWDTSPNSVQDRGKRCRERCGKWLRAVVETLREADPSGSADGRKRPGNGPERHQGPREAPRIPPPRAPNALFSGAAFSRCFRRGKKRSGGGSGIRGCGAMYEIHIESEEFREKRMVQQHQMVNQALSEEIKAMHGLRIFTSIPKELPPAKSLCQERENGK